jgi:hypothetical protein
MLKVLKMQLLTRKTPGQGGTNEESRSRGKDSGPTKETESGDRDKDPRTTKEAEPGRHPRKIGETDRRTHHICHPFAVDAGKYRRRMDIQ